MFSCSHVLMFSWYLIKNNVMKHLVHSKLVNIIVHSYLQIHMYLQL